MAMPIFSDYRILPHYSSIFPDCKMDYDMDEKAKPLLLVSRASTEVQLPEPDYPLLPSGAEKPLKPVTRIQGHRLQVSQLPLEKSICKSDCVVLVICMYVIELTLTRLKAFVLLMTIK